MGNFFLNKIPVTQPQYNYASMLHYIKISMPITYKHSMNWYIQTIQSVKYNPPQPLITFKSFITTNTFTRFTFWRIMEKLSQIHWIAVPKNIKSMFVHVWSLIHIYGTCQQFWSQLSPTETNQHESKIYKSYVTHLDLLSDNLYVKLKGQK